METQKTNQMNFTESIIDLIFNSLNIKHIDKLTVTSETPLMKGGLNLDSVDILELIVNFEKKYGIKLNESEAYAEHFKNIGSVVEFIKLKTTTETSEMQKSL